MGCCNHASRSACGSKADSMQRLSACRARSAGSTPIRFATRLAMTSLSSLSSPTAACSVSCTSSGLTCGAERIQRSFRHVSSGIGMFLPRQLQTAGTAVCLASTVPDCTECECRVLQMLPCARHAHQHAAMWPCREQSHHDCCTRCRVCGVLVMSPNVAHGRCSHQTGSQTTVASAPSCRTHSCTSTHRAPAMQPVSAA